MNSIHYKLKLSNSVSNAKVIMREWYDVPDFTCSAIISVKLVSGNCRISYEKCVRTMQVVELKCKRFENIVLADRNIANIFYEAVCGG